MAIPPRLIDGIHRLDPLPATLQRLMRALDDEDAGAYVIGEIVQFDHAVVSMLLRVANSVAYGGWVRTESVRQAVTRIGKARVVDLIMGDHIRKLQGAAPMFDLSEEDLWLHSTAASLAVRAVARECPQAGLTESAAIAGLVHDVGKLVMVRYLKADVSALLALRDERKITFVQAERELFGCDHAEVGGEMARHWGFPPEIQEAIARHHEAPIENSTPLLDAVIVANLAAKSIGAGLGAEGMDMIVDDRCHFRLKLDFAGFSRVCLATMSGLKDVATAYGVTMN
ncbi:MAG: HDOD domain-containing protein [Acidobacteria bacterium]|nr:HDOD domain-containing protein [Acidobacteriota bacterium]